jgi:hypothetical protein
VEKDIRDKFSAAGIEITDEQVMAIIEISRNRVLPFDVLVDAIIRISMPSWIPACAGMTNRV